MNLIIQSKVIKIGNSRGVRIPRPLLEQAGLTEDIEMTVEGDRLVIKSINHPRQGWSERFAEMAEHGDDHLLDEMIPTRWDEEEWVW